MAVIYDCVADYGAGRRADFISSCPYWIVAIFRMKFPTTYSRKSKASISQTFSDAVEIRGKPLIITDDCVRLDVSSSKTSYLHQMQASFLNSGFNYIGDVFPGDYTLAWMFTNKKDFESVLDRLNKGSACNGFLDGLKFFGRVQSMRKTLIQNPDGTLMSRYNMQAVAFEAFDASVFYDPYLARKYPAIGQQWAAIQTSIVKFSKNQSGFVTVNDAIPFWLDLLLGKGVPPNLGTSSSDPRLQSTTGLEADHSYILPQVCGTILNKSTASKQLLRYADVLETIVGIQKYQPAAAGTSNSNFSPVSQGFQPDQTNSGGSRRFTSYAMLGSFIAQVPQFTNKNVWSVLRQYINPMINEMYTCLRVNPAGDVVPTLVARQLPFTSMLLNTSLDVTRFVELPRWGVDPVMVKQVDVGRSDSTRFNFVHIYGDAPDYNHSMTSQIVQNPPIRDDLDIARSGLRPYQATVPCHPIDSRNGSAEKWMSIASDIVMGQQLTMTGTISAWGIQAPICVGDNLEWDDMVFHIEGLQHSCFIGATGNKSFTTTVNLTHGMQDHPNPATDIDLYSEVPATFDPGHTRDTTLGDPDNSAPLTSTKLSLQTKGQGVVNGDQGLDLDTKPGAA